MSNNEKKSRTTARRDSEQKISGLPRAFAHDFRNCLSGIRLNMDMDPSNRPAANEAARDIEIGLTRIELLTENLCLLSNDGAVTEIASTPLGPVLERAIARLKPLATVREVDLVGAIPQESLTVAGPLRLCENIVTNALLNAIEAAPENTEVRFSIQPVAGHSICFTIHDRGTPVANEHVALLFHVEPLDRLTDERVRTGKNLSLAALGANVRRLGGSVTARSPEDHGGFILEVTLPLMMVS